MINRPERFLNANVLSDSPETRRENDFGEKKKLGDQLPRKEGEEEEGEEEKEEEEDDDDEEEMKEDDDGKESKVSQNIKKRTCKK